MTTALFFTNSERIPCNMFCLCETGGGLGRTAQFIDIESKKQTRKARNVSRVPCIKFESMSCKGVQ
jgi:hypothetical protein